MYTHPQIGQDPWGDDLLTGLSQLDSRTTVVGISVKEFGAAGDGVTDDTTAIQAAFDAAHTLGGSAVVPPGTYLISSAINGYPNVNVIGAGNSVSIIKQGSASADAFVMEFTVDTPVRSYLKDIRFTGPGRGVGTGRGVVIGPTVDGVPGYGLGLSRVYVEQFGSHGFDLHGNFMVGIDGCESWDNGGRGFWFDGGTITPTGTWQTSTTVTNCYANHNVGEGFRIDKGTYMTFQACGSDNNSTGYSVYDCTCLTFVSCGAESPDDTARQASVGTQAVGFKVDGDPSLGSSNILFIGCYAYAVTDTGYYFSGASVNCQLIGSRHLHPAGIPAMTGNGRFVGTGASVQSVGCTIAGSTLIESGAKHMELIAAEANGDPGGIRFDGTSPKMFPWKDSIQFFSAAAGNIPIQIIGVSGQQSFFRAQEFDGTNIVSVYGYGTGTQMQFGEEASNLVQLYRADNSTKYLSTNTPFRPGLTATSVSNLNSTFPPADYAGCIATVATDKGTRIVVSDGIHWLTPMIPASGYNQPVQQDGTY